MHVWIFVCMNMNLYLWFCIYDSVCPSVCLLVRMNIPIQSHLCMPVWCMHVCKAVYLSVKMHIKISKTSYTQSISSPCLHMWSHVGIMHLCMWRLYLGLAKCMRWIALMYISADACHAKERPATYCDVVFDKSMQWWNARSTIHAIYNASIMQCTLLQKMQYKIIEAMQCSNWIYAWINVCTQWCSCMYGCMLVGIHASIYQSVYASMRICVCVCVCVCVRSMCV